MLPELISHSPWYFYLLSVILALLFTLLLYYKNEKNKDLSKPVLIGLTALRFLSSFLILFLLLQLFFKQTKNETEAPIIILAIDNSTSIASFFNSTDSTSTLVKTLNELEKTLGEKYSIHTLLFGSKTENQSTTPKFRDKETDIEQLFLEVTNNYGNQNIGAFIIASDGIYNRGANPVYLAEKLGYPVYTIALGDTNAFKDLAIQKINHNQIAYYGNNFPVEVQVIAKKFKDQLAKVSLHQNGQEISSQTLKINSEQFSAVLNFSLNAGNKGINKYQAKIEILKGEKNTSNNSQTFVVEVIDNREKILLLANAPHPDVSALKESILNNSIYELDFQVLAQFNKNLQAYSMVIFHGLATGQTQLVEDCKNKGIPFWIVNPRTPDIIPAVRINGSFNKWNDAEAFFNPAFDLFTLSEAFKKFVPELPGLKTFFGNYLVNNSSQSLMFQKIGLVETDQPVFVFNEVAGLKTACFIGDGLWKWKMRDFAEHHNHLLFDEMLSKTIQYLAVKNDKSMFRIKHPKIVYENELIEMEAEVYNKSYELITEPEVSLVLNNEKNEKFNYTFSKSNKNYKVALGSLAPGEYNYLARVKQAEQFQEKRGVILVKEVVAEKLNAVANHQLLQQLSSKSGGKLFYLREMNALKEELLNSQKIKTVTYSQNSVLRPIDLKWFFVLILCLLGLEWFIRKRYLRI